MPTTESQNVKENFLYLYVLLVWVFIIIPHQSFGNSINVEAAYGAKSTSLEADRRNILNDPLQYDPEWIHDRKIILAINCTAGDSVLPPGNKPSQDEINLMWEKAWKWAKKGNLQARELIMSSIIYNGLIRPGGSEASDNNHRRDIVILAIHSLGSEIEKEKAYQYIVLPVFLGKNDNNKNFWACFKESPSKQCAEMAVKSKIVPSFNEYAEEIEKAIADGKQASCTR